MKSLSIKISFVEKVNLALLQNKIPLIQAINVTNNSDQDLEDLFVIVQSDPSTAFSAKVPIALIRAQESLIIDNPQLIHSWDFFKSCSERILGTIKVSIIQNDKCLVEECENIEFNTSNTWLGQIAPIELLCSHILPNSVEVQSIIRRASDFLNENTGSSALNGYQSKSPKRVYEIAQAIYIAIREKKITYTEPPASFEQSGQKIRDVNDILHNGLGTCLDLTLLFAACLEQSGLNPLVFLIKGHAFIGLWLENKNLPRPFDEDAQFFRKRIELQEILVFETTAVTQSETRSFSSIEKIALEYFNNEEEFQFGVDVIYCRRSLNIHPLNEFTKPIDYVNDNESGNRNDSILFEQKEFNKIDLPVSSNARKGELEKWQDKLLDLTFRNKLLNFKATNSTVKIDCINPAEMEDILADGSSFELLELAEQTELELNRSDKNDVASQKLEVGFKNHKLYTNLTQKKFQTTLNGIFRSNRNIQEETGANTLFLALGLICWTESDISDKPRYSPLILLPIELKKKTAGGRFSISIRDDDTVFNHTLLQKFNRDFGLNFPGLDPLPEDESGVDVPKIFNIIRKVIKDKRGWEVKEDVWLSEFTFQKFLMWKELNEHYEEMLQSPVVRRIMENTAIDNDPLFIGEDKVEKYLPLEKVYCPLSADSSQLAAIFSAAEGKSFVLQGPPGTGKSQTIANMISHCLGHGKRVLFVSEKKVALEVVYKRLKAIGLGPLCLELHSKKSEKKAVIQSFVNALEYTSNNRQSEWLSISGDVHEAREELNGYFGELHDVKNGDISAYQAFIKSGRDEDVYKFNIDIPDISQITTEKIHQLKSKIETWLKTAEVLDDNAYKAWKYCGTLKWTPNIEDDLKSIILKNLSLKLELEPLLKDKSNSIPYTDNWNQIEWKLYSDLIMLLMEPLDINDEYLSSTNWKQEKDKLTELIPRLNHYTTITNELAVFCDLKILEQDLNYLKLLLEKTKKGFVLKKVISSFKLNRILKKFQSKTANRDKTIKLAYELMERGDEYKSDLTEFNSKFTINYTIEKSDLYIKYLQKADYIREIIALLFSNDIDLMIKARTSCTYIIKNKDLLFSEGSKVKLNNIKLSKNIQNQITYLNELFTKFSFKQDLLNFGNDKIIWIMDEFKSTFEEFRDVCVMNKIQTEINQEGFKGLFQALYSEIIERNELIKVFEYN